jgi:phosphoserine phosphatase RsbU/P
MSIPTVQSERHAVDSDKAARSLYALLDLSKALSSVVDLDDLLTAIVDKASAVVDAERTTIFVYDAARDILWSRVAQGLEIGTIEVPMGAGVAGDVARTRVMANIPDAYSDPRFSAETDRKSGFRTRNILCAPVLDSKGKLLGVIQSINKAGSGQFDEHDESLMTALGAHVAVAVERAQVTELQIDNERFEEALRLANDIQMRMLPSGKVSLPEGAPFSLNAFIRPAKHVGGDLYDFFWTDDRLHFCIGDVTGKGIGAALVMAVTKTLVRALAAFEEDPARLLSAVSERLHEETDPSMFVTAFCGSLDLRSGRLHYSNAGHDRPLIVTPGKPVRRLDSKSGLPLGVLAKFTYVVEEIVLEPGDALFLYTDGVTEATNRRDEMFTIERVRQVLGETASADPASLIDTIVTQVDKFAEMTPQADDLTMLCIEYRGLREFFKRDINELDRLFAFLRRVADDRTIDLGVEEIFTNFAKHNAAGTGDIEVRLLRDGDHVTVALTDPDTDPFSIDAKPDVGAPLDQRTPGGLGLYLTAKMMDGIDYRYDGRAATITLQKRLG